IVAAETSQEQRGATKWVRGKLTGISGSNITVSSGGKDLVFSVDSDTDIIARGASTKVGAAQREGRTGVPLDTLLKVGEWVEVHYHETGGKLHAAEIRGGIPAQEATGTTGDRQAGTSARGTVTAVSDSSLTIMSGEKELIFAVDDKTLVEGEGFNRLTRQLREKGERPTLPKYFATNDYVSVRYHEMGGKMHAEQVLLVRKPPR
ncbi:MAG TPA: DUF5666 domain-containing protein, partial [Vicinamibacterales bacterium]|nr:DUF5666 domain-containing protein [Vicinamibacterales bacterium]